MSSDSFREILNNDGYTYVLKSENTEPLDINFPNLPDWHREDFESRHSDLPDVTVIWFEWKRSNYKLLINGGDGDCNDGNFGAVFDTKNNKILDLLSSGDMETTIKSRKKGDKMMSDELSTKLSPYWQYFEVVLHNTTEFEYLVFKILVENEWFHSIDDIEDEDEDEDGSQTS